MRRNIRAALTAAGLVVASLSLASCGHLGRVAKARPAPASKAAPAAAPVATSASVWALRSGLNVAALSCRGKGREPVAGDYARLLTRHRTLLADAYAREQKRQGAAAFDRAQTRVYNTFSNQASAAYFCEAAKAVARQANGLGSPALASAAPQLVRHLQVALRMPAQRLAVRSR